MHDIQAVISRSGIKVVRIDEDYSEEMGNEYCPDEQKLSEAGGSTTCQGY